MRLFFGFIFSALGISASGRDITGNVVDLISYSDGHSFIKIENGPASGCSDLTTIR